jgi:predicted phosphoribosyltransferase
MGYYLQSPGRFNKAAQLKDVYGALEVSREEAASFIRDTSKAVVCVVQNPGQFDAAAFCYDEDEFRRFNQVSDDRPRRWLIFDNRAQVEELTGYRQDADAVRGNL